MKHLKCSSCEWKFFALMSHFWFNWMFILPLHLVEGSHRAWKLCCHLVLKIIIIIKKVMLKLSSTSNRNVKYNMYLVIFQTWSNGQDVVSLLGWTIGIGFTRSETALTRTAVVDCDLINAIWTMFYDQLLRAQIPKVQKDTYDLSVFCTLGICMLKGCA